MPRKGQVGSFFESLLLLLLSDSFEAIEFAERLPNHFQITSLLRFYQVRHAINIQNNENYSLGLSRHFRAESGNCKVKG